MKKVILIVEDDERMRKALVRLIQYVLFTAGKLEDEIVVLQANSIPQMIALVDPLFLLRSESVEFLVCTDWYLEGRLGGEFIKYMDERSTSVRERMILSGGPMRGESLQAIAADLRAVYFNKPMEGPEQTRFQSIVHTFATKAY
jgi:hypothetical protein